MTSTNQCERHGARGVRDIAGYRAVRGATLWTETRCSGQSPRGTEAQAEQRRAGERLERVEH
jgi:hypothetical protein